MFYNDGNMLLDMLVIIIGLSLFEMITSVDNAVINAEVLSTVSQKMRRWFLTWGMLFAVFIMRGLLPLLIVMAAFPGTGLLEALTFSASAEALEASSAVLLMTGGVFLVFVFLHWLFIEPKIYGLHGERFFHGLNVWFYAVISIFLVVVVWFALPSMTAFGAVLGSTIFFIVNGFRLNAEKIEHEMVHKKGMSEWSKILYLEAIDASFSIDGVVGAFAFTFSVPLIILGNGLGALAVRQLTVANIEHIKRFKYLKHGAMYSIFILGMIMIAEAFGAYVPSWLSPASAITVMGYFFWRSVKMS